MYMSQHEAEYHKQMIQEQIAPLLKRIEKLEAMSSADRQCDHDWKIWPETNGQSQRCMKCGNYRDTPIASPNQETGK